MAENCHHFNTAKKSSNFELMTSPSIHILKKSLKNKTKNNNNN